MNKDNIEHTPGPLINANLITPEFVKEVEHLKSIISEQAKETEELKSAIFEELQSEWERGYKIAKSENFYLIEKAFLAGRSQTSWEQFKIDNDL